MHKRFFTLIELLAVIGIVAVLAAITIGGLSFATAKADEAKTLALMEEFEIALEKYKEDYGVYPIQTAAGDVNFSDTIWDNFTNKNNNKRGKPYMEGIGNISTFEDGFGNAFQYQYPNNDDDLDIKRNITKYALWSKGPNGVNGKKREKEDPLRDSPKVVGEIDSDDICSWKQK